jgi:hypothetical protein
MERLFISEQTENEAVLRSFLSQQNVIDEHRHPILFMIAGDQVGRGQHVGTGVSHGHAQSGVADHRDVVDVVTDRADFLRFDPPELCQVKDGGPFTGVMTQELAHRALIAWTSLDERLYPAVHRIECRALECEHLAARPDRADVK